ncbi:NF045616 family extracytoplasmic (lipo)protein [Acinetobacter piscicola]|uniref:NF045616 family extracytoplasmic (lipo)protein n=1 Tax=Acinetobacter piscicola TaxID=2006115 RepID=UPI000B7FC034|nr:NF045616 family extracytoplasmic (lipo)protein [Acinetobacter piscicola]
MFKLTVALSILVLIGCTQMSKELDVIIKNNSLCFFTNDPDTNYYDSNKELLIYINKLEHKKEIATVFEKKYTNSPLPIKEKDCLKIPINTLKKDTPYLVSLEMRRTYIVEICLKNNNNRILVQKITTGEKTCPVN